MKNRKIGDDQMTIKKITLENLDEEFIFEDKKSKSNHKNWDMFCKICKEHAEEFRNKIAEYKKDKETK